MTEGHIGYRHAGLSVLLHQWHFLLCRIPAPALDSGKYLRSIAGACGVSVFGRPDAFMRELPMNKGSDRVVRRCAVRPH